MTPHVLFSGHSDERESLIMSRRHWSSQDSRQDVKLGVELRNGYCGPRCSDGEMVMITAMLWIADVGVLKLGAYVGRRFNAFYLVSASQPTRNECSALLRIESLEKGYERPPVWAAPRRLTAIDRSRGMDGARIFAWSQLRT